MRFAKLAVCALLLASCANEVPDAGTDDADSDVGVVSAALSSGAIAPSLQATIFSEATGNNRGGRTSNCVGRVQNDDRYAFVEFDVSGIEENVTVTQVVLAFSINGVRSTSAIGTYVANVTPTNQDLELRRVTSSWVQGTGLGQGACYQGSSAGDVVRWAEQPSVAGQSATMSIGTGTGAMTLTRTSGTMVSDVQGWIDSNSSNHGWRFDLTGTTNDTARSITFTSLTVTYFRDNGQSCTSDAQCLNHCVHPDGADCGGRSGCICCNASTCTGACESCFGASAGTCSASNTTGSVCRTQACIDGDTQRNQTTCNGSSTSCPSQTTTECNTYICTSNACRTTCTQQSHCTAGNYCNGSNQCVAKLANGAVCTDGDNGEPSGGEASDQCSSGSCVDGRCCNSACEGQCQACDVGGSLGACTAVSGAPHGSRTACTNGGSGCGGACNGVTTGSCAYPSTQCRSQSCSGSTLTQPASCSGGNCPSVSTTSCSPYVCNGGGTACLASCSVDANCASGFWCSGGSCIARQANGTTCSAALSGRECLTGNCVDGRCCNAACTGQCQACDNGGSLGTCSNVTSGPPHGSRTACADTAEGCGGACDGSSPTECGYPGAETSCRAASCDAPTNTATLGAVCQGDGACGALTEVSCNPYMCMGDSCAAGTCEDDDDCVLGFFCDTDTMTCVGTLPNGSMCVLGTECTSGECVDGVCCDRGCDGQCEACNLTGSIGTCATVSTGAPRNGRPACANSGEGCGGTCDGSSAAACGYPGGGTSCRTASCASGTATEPAGCNGAGACAATSTVDCAPYDCAGTVCASTCGSTLDCDAGYFCNTASRCVLLQGDGTSCGRDEDCASGECVDGVCCNGSCDGQCEACDVAGNVGSCVAVSGAPHGGRLPCASDGTGCGGSCDGSTRDACGFPGAAMSCRDTSCSTELLTEAAVCDGDGTCGALVRTPCSPFRCLDTSICRSTCVADTECVRGAFCNSDGLCQGILTGGEVCETDGQCVSGFCTDGVCCDGRCDGQCEACDASGACGAVVGAPVGERAACAGDGTICDGACDGVERAACSFPDTSTSCSVEGCTDGISVPDATCDGAGSCPAEGTACAPYLCSGIGCGTSCTDDDDCSTGSFCDGGECAGATPNGGVCALAGECASGFCVDGVCCDTDCTGQCGSCSVPGRLGTCSGILGVPRNGRPACDTDGTVCGGRCDGDTLDACVYPDTARVCRPPSCMSSRAVQEATCNGDGTCPAEVVVDCEAACDGDECGAIPEDAGPPPADAGVVDDAGGDGLDAGVRDAGADAGMGDDDGGCSCRATGAPTGSRGWPLALLAGLALLIRRRRG